MATPDVTVAVVPRERFSLTWRALDNVRAHTAPSVPLVYVSAGAPAPVRQYLQDASQRHAFALIDTDRYLSPNQARNLALRAVSTKYVVFLDNDALVTPGWLEHLVACADQTDASMVGPLYLIGEIEEQRIHMAGGTLHFKQRDGRRIAYDEHRLGDVALSDVPAPISRQRCDFVEFHCILLRTDLFDRIGELDEQLLSVHEHIDVGWSAREAGGSVYLEPSAVASYVAPPPFDWSDLPYFMLRWCDDWTSASLERFRQKWGVDTTRHFGDEDSDVEVEDTALRWGRGHRRLAAGIRVPPATDTAHRSAVEQARLMVGLLLSVDRDRFDTALTTEEDVQVEVACDITAERLLNGLPDVIARADRERLNVLIRPRPSRRPSEPSLLRLTVDDQGLRQVEPYGFLTLKAEPGRYEVWIAVDAHNWRSASVLRRLTSASSGRRGRFARVAGSPIVELDDDAAGGRVVLHGGVAGSITTGTDLESGGLLPYLWSSDIY